MFKRNMDAHHIPHIESLKSRWWLLVNEMTSYVVRDKQSYDIDLVSDSRIINES